MTTLVHYVDATFDGTRQRFELRRARIEAFERRLRWSASETDVAMGASAFAAMRRFHSGAWTAADVEQTLAFAGERQNAMQRQSEAMERRFGKSALSEGRNVIATPLDVLPAIERDGHAAYAALAETVLRAALLGITEAEADFDTYEAEAA